MRRLLGICARAGMGEEDRVPWAGQGTWGVETVRKVGGEGEVGGAGLREAVVVPLRDFKWVWSPLNPKNLSGPRTHS